MLLCPKYRRIVRLFPRDPRMRLEEREEVLRALGGFGGGSCHYAGLILGFWELRKLGTIIGFGIPAFSIKFL
jgi:hypothetical protein